MIDIYEMVNGKVAKTDEIKEDVWINMINPTSAEIDLVQSALDIDREALTAALDDESSDGFHITHRICSVIGLGVDQ